MDTKETVYAIGICLTFILGVWNLANNYLQTKKTSFINTVTKQRVEWLERIRQDVSRFSGLTHTWTFSRLEGKPEEFEVLKELDQLRNVIKLRLNPDDTPDRKISALIDKIPDLTHETKHEELKQALRELMTETQAMLKAEWEKVKRESEEGNLSKKNST